MASFEITRTVGDAHVRPITLPVTYTGSVTTTEGAVALRCEIRNGLRTLQVTTPEGVKPWAVCSMTPGAVQFFGGELRIALNEFLAYVDAQEAAATA